jgi:hypothetical protein
MKLRFCLFYHRNEANSEKLHTIHEQIFHKKPRLVTSFLLKLGKRLAYTNLMT